MIRNLLIACSIFVSAFASAAPSWIQVEVTDTSTILLDRSSVARVGDFELRWVDARGVAAEEAQHRPESSAQRR